MAGRLARVRSKADSALDGHRYESTDSSDDEAMRAVPAGCLGRTGVRLVAEARAGEDERGRTGEKGYSVVDTNQFRNTQVGSGYQASFVVRQPGAAPAAPPTRVAPPVDAKKRKKESKKDKKSKKKHKKKKARRPRPTPSTRHLPVAAHAGQKEKEAEGLVLVLRRRRERRRRRRRRRGARVRRRRRRRGRAPAALGPLRGAPGRRPRATARQKEAR